MIKNNYHNSEPNLNITHTSLSSFEYITFLYVFFQDMSKARTGYFFFFKFQQMFDILQGGGPHALVEVFCYPCQPSQYIYISNHNCYIIIRVTRFISRCQILTSVYSQMFFQG